MDKLVVRGTEINVLWNPNRDDYISLTDIARIKDSDNPRYIIQNWMRNRNTIEFLGVWESLYNLDFNRVEFDAFRSQAGLNSFVMTPQKWIEATQAIGITAKAGRYGGTYAHKEIAFEFASWISVKFKLYTAQDRGDETTWLGHQEKPFSSRNLCRMREFFRIYENVLELHRLAMKISWTQNVTILEVELTIEERAWYLQAAERCSWSKKQLENQISASAHLENPHDDAQRMAILIRMFLHIMALFSVV